jgi:tRNA-specific 2-thiouridylase
MSKSRIVVAMSGGVDSSATAALLKEQGHEVIGVTLKLYDQAGVDAKAKSCCAGRDIRDARRVADTLGIPHYVIDAETVFKTDVILPFVESYIRGETPIPCVACNRTVKFRDLMGLARDLGAEALATGHYARRADGAAGPILLKGADPARDQSYFLFGTTRAQLDYLRFPLGAMASKDETRRIAARHDLAVIDKPDSQDICFVPDGNYARLIERLRPGAAEGGDIVDLAGAVLGRHPGLIHYTIGQRRGLGLAAPDPLYVVRLEPETRRVVVGPKSALAKKTIRLGGVNWLGEGDGHGIAVSVRVRSTRPPAPATLWLGDDGAADIDLDGAEEGVAPGQACVFYDGDRVLGGGWIKRED